MYYPIPISVGNTTTRVSTLTARQSAMTEIIAGSCLCNLVSFEISGPFDSFYFCHCSCCQKNSGSAHAANLFGGPNSITWLTGKEHIKNFELSETTYFNKSFCLNCGSPVPHKAKSGNFFIIPAGTLNSDPDLKPQYTIFWGNRATWYDEGCISKKFICAHSKPA